MAPSPSITTILCALESPSRLTDTSATLSLILLTQTTNKDATRHLLLQAGSGVSTSSSLSFCRRFIYFLRDAHCLSIRLRRTRRFRRPRNSDEPIGLNLRRMSTSFLSPCCAIEVLWLSRSGKTSIPVSLWFVNYEIFNNWKCRELRKIVHN